MSQLGSITLALEMAHVLYLDFVVDPGLPEEQRRAIEQEVERVVAGTAEVESARKSDQLTVHNGDHALALLFFTDLEAPIRCAAELSRALRTHTPNFKVRMGAHAGAAYREASLRANRAVSSGGVNVAQRLSDCGNEGHILVSGTTADFLLQLGNWSTSLHDLGEFELGEGQRQRVFNFYGPDFGNPEFPLRAKRADPPSVRKSPPDDPMIGRQVSHYKIGKKLAAGTAAIIDCGGRTMMPGLIDSHVHVMLSEVNIRFLESVPLTLGMTFLGLRLLGQGLNLMIETAIKQTKPLPNFAGSGPHEVRLVLAGTVQNPAFIRFLERLGDERLARFSTADFLTLDALQREQPLTPALESRLTGRPARRVHHAHPRDASTACRLRLARIGLHGGLSRQGLGCRVRGDGRFGPYRGREEMVECGLCPKARLRRDRRGPECPRHVEPGHLTRSTTGGRW